MVGIRSKQGEVVFLSRSDEETVGRIALQKGQCGTAESELGERSTTL
jgi:hypothetical protein